MKKRILIFSMTVLTLVIMTLPMIPAAQAYGWEKSENTYAFTVTSGLIVADEGEVDFREARNWDFGKYTAHSENFIGDELFSISWNDGTTHVLEGTEVLLVSYKINSDSYDGDTIDGGKLCQGIVNFKVEITFEGGKFKGHMQWVGDLVLKPDNTVRLPYTFAPFNEAGSYAWYTYWQGTGAYSGWKITQRFGPAVAEPESGLLLIR